MAPSFSPRISACLLSLSLAFGAGLAQRAGAAVTETPITNGFYSTASGTLNGVPFNTTFSIFGSYYPSDIQTTTLDSHAYSADYYSCWVLIAGRGSFQITTPLRTFVTGGYVGLSRAGVDGTDLTMVPPNSEIAGWNMQDSLGPITLSGSMIQWTLSPIQTTEGVLIFNNQPASIQFTSYGIPETSTTALAGAAGVLLLVRRRRTVV